MADAKARFIQTVYEKINAVLGNDNQLFVMEFPARGLNPADFEYSTEHRTSAVTKPFSVREKEFRLADDLFGVGRITGGPTGEKLSTVYEAIINNYVPRLDSYVAFAKDKVLARRWLTEEVSYSQPDGSSTRLSRIGLCEELMNQYLNARLRWEEKKKQQFDTLKRDAETKTADGKPDPKRLNDAMDEYARWIGSVGMIEDERLNQLYNDVVVRGNLHEVMTFLGFLNAATTAETLESTKQFIRNSARLSIDGASKIFPVNFNPSNWFQALRPNFSPKDLTMSREALATQYKSKTKSLTDLKQQKAELETMHVSKTEVAELTAAIGKEQEAAHKLEAKFLSSQTEATFKAAKMAYAAYAAYKVRRAGPAKEEAPLAEGGEKRGGKADPKGPAPAADQAASKVFAERLKSLNDEERSEDEVAAILAEMAGINEALDQVLASKSRLSGLMANEAMLKSHNFQAQIQKLNSQIEIVTADLQYLEPLVAGAIQIHEKDTVSNRDKNLAKRETELLAALKKQFPGQPFPAKPDGKWASELAGEQKTFYDQALSEYQSNEVVEKALLPDQDMNVSDLAFSDIIISSSKTENASKRESEASASASSARFGGWFANVNYSNSQSAAQASFEETALAEDFECGFRVAKVTIDRGGWFNPSLLKMSSAFYRLADMNGGGGLDMAMLNATDAKTQELVRERAARSLLPAYPVSFIIAKDITFKLSRTETESAGSNKNSKADSAIGGGFGPFSASSASSSSSASESAYSGVHNDSLYIRIPGPQILGWYLQFTPDDQSKPYTMQSNENRNGVLDILTFGDELMLNEIRTKRLELERVPESVGRLRQDEHTVL